MKDIMGLMKQAKEMQAKMEAAQADVADLVAQGRSGGCLLYTSPSPRDRTRSRMPSSA